MTIPYPVPRGNNGILALVFTSLFLATSLLGYLTLDTYMYPAEESPIAPSLPSAGIIGDGPVPVATHQTQIPVHWNINWTISNIYPKWGGVLDVYVENTGNNKMYIHTLGISPQATDWLDDNITRDVQVFIPAGETGHVGLLSFPGPPMDTRTYYGYQLLIGLYVRDDNYFGNTGTERWYDEGMIARVNRTFTIDSIEDELPVFYTHSRNDLWERVEDLTSPNDPQVASVANDIRDTYGKGYTAYHIAAAFDHVRTHIGYEIELPGQDNWQEPGETLVSCSGDCEDHSLVLISLIKNLGGTPRMNIIAGHAFTTIYIGETEEEATRVWNAIEDYYGTPLQPCWIVDDGYWLCADTLGGIYLGSMPVNTALTGTNTWDWGFTSTMVVSMISI